jgi:D-alanyl-D-alanine carboxypeptidase
LAGGIWLVVKRLALTLIIGTAVLGLALIGGALLGSSLLPLGDRASVARCEGVECAVGLTPPEAAEASALVPTSPPPCPYCGQNPDKWQTLTLTPPPVLLAPSAALIEASCGRLIYGLNEHERLPPASIAKIVTALVAAEQTSLSTRVPITINGWDLAAEDGSSIAGLEAGMELTVEELLYAMLLPSGNDAALALAEHFGGNAAFVRLMNQRVARAGLTNTRLLNPDGRDAEGSYTSALDIALLGRELLANPALREVAGTQTRPASWDGHLLWNTNYLVYGFEGATGVKFGFTEAAKETVVGSAKRDGRELIVSVLASDFAYLDAVRLMNWAFANTALSC